MAKLKDKIKNFFTYKEPTNEERGFELLEDQNEVPASPKGNIAQQQGTQQQGAQQQGPQQQGAQQQGAQQQGSQQQGAQQQGTQQQGAQQQGTQQQGAQQQGTFQQGAQQQGTQQQGAQQQSTQQQGTQQQSAQQQGAQQQGTQQQGTLANKKIKTKKQPKSVDEWNAARKAESEDNGQKSQEKGDPGQNNNACTPVTDSDILSTELCVNLATINQKFFMPRNNDIIIREFRIGRKVKAFMAYLDGMTYNNILNLSIYPSLMEKDVFEGLGEECPLDYLIENILTTHNVRKTDKYSDAVTQILNGYSALFVESCGECALIETRGYEKRSVEQPITETVVKGSQEGFTENLRTNVTLIRRIIRNENLVTEMLPVGNTNHSMCAVIYLEGIVDPRVVQEVIKRLKRIDTDFILGDGMIEQFIEDNSFMLFPQVLSTERPDRTASFIMEGQVVVIADGTPFALTMPITFFRLFHTSEDSNVRWPASNFLRLIRLFGLFCATLLPGLYVAISLYHVEMIPTELLLSIARAKEVVPFPTIIEVLMMEVSFELIREGGIRVPSVIGQTLGIVGALILGQAAVTAGLVSPMLVIVVSITGLGSFAIPNYTLAMAIRIERFIFILAGAVLGFYGISLILALLAYLACSMKSFGVPYFSPVAPRTKVNPDVILKYPIWMQKERPDEFNTQNRKRQGNNVKKWMSEKNDSKGPGEKQ